MTDEFEKIFDNFDNNMKLIDYYCEIETFLKLDETHKNINRINVLLLESTQIVLY
jgi:hypothetical protein